MSDVSRFTRRELLSAIGGASALAHASGIATARDDPYVDDSGEFLTLANSDMELSFDRDRGTLKQIYSKDHDQTFLDESRSGQYMWTVGFYHPDDIHLHMTSAHGGTPTIDTQQQGGEVSLRFSWKNPRLKAEGDALDGEVFDGGVDLGVRLTDDSPEARYWMQIRNNDDLAVRMALFPTIQGIKALSEDGSDSLYVPIGLGRRVPNPTAQPYTPTNRYPTGQGAMQFTAFIDDTEELGLVGSATDTAGHMKRLEFLDSSEETLDYAGNHLEPFRPGEDVDIPYEMTFGIHRIARRIPRPLN